MKLIGNIGSIEKNSNRLVSSSYSDWSAVREGTFIKFNDDFHFYTVSHTEQRVFLKDFSVTAPNIIQINENCGVNINIGDSLNISFKEYELDTYKIISTGKKYKVGDRLTLDGGTASLNITNNTLNSTIITVTKIGSEGQIDESIISERGKYLIVPNSNTALKGGFGAGSSIETAFKLTDHRTFIDRDVDKVEFKNAATYISLVYPLPASTKEGKLSIEKWEIILSSNYLGETNNNETFEITRDFTPYCKIPLIAPNSKNPELSFNTALAILDKKIAELENKVKELENKDIDCIRVNTKII